jgi:hypothetical protein
VKIASENRDFTLTKMSETCVVGWIIIATKVQQWTDIVLLFVERFNLNTVLDVITYNNSTMIFKEFPCKKKSPFRSDGILHRISENMIKMPDNQS